MWIDPRHPQRAHQKDSEAQRISSLEDSLRFRDDSDSVASVAVLVGVNVLVGKSHGHQPQGAGPFADVHVSSFHLFFFLLIFSP